DPWLNVLARANPDGRVRQHGLAVGVARMVDETRVVAADASVDVAIGRDIEEERMRIVRVVVAITRSDLRFGQALPSIGDQHPARANSSRRENAEAVNLRPTLREGRPNSRTMHVPA